MVVLFVVQVKQEHVYIHVLALGLQYEAVFMYVWL